VYPLGVFVNAIIANRWEFHLSVADGVPRHRFSIGHFPSLSRPDHPEFHRQGMTEFLERIAGTQNQLDGLARIRRD
jgi:hypothetical protein